jgi:calcium-dependent protein kinase
LTHRWLKEQLGDTEISAIRRGSLAHKNVRTGAFANYLTMKKLKKAALGYIASNLTQAEVASLKEIFQSMDRNRDGYITLTELDEAIARGRFNSRILHDLQELRTDRAVAGNQVIDWRDFVASTMDRSVALREDNMRMAFEHFRHSSAEYLTIDDLVDIFGGLAQAQEVMALIDNDRDGKVSFDDFRHAIAESMDDLEEERKESDIDIDIAT